MTAAHWLKEEWFNAGRPARHLHWTMKRFSCRHPRVQLVQLLAGWWSRLRSPSFLWLLWYQRDYSRLPCQDFQPCYFPFGTWTSCLRSTQRTMYAVSPTEKMRRGENRTHRNIWAAFFDVDIVSFPLLAGSAVSRNIFSWHEWKYYSFHVPSWPDHLI